MSGNGNEWPTEIRLSPGKDVLHIEFESGGTFRLPAEFLRVHSPSAEVTGHGAEERKILGGKRLVRITAVEPTGNYAVRLLFSDGHSTGIFTWSYLHELGRNYQALWRQYLADLEKQGLRRD
jgi:DUF971 family protein